MNAAILIHLATGFEETEAITIVDVLRRANLDAITVSVTGSLNVAGAHNITILADQLYDEADYSHAGMIVLPGGMPGTTNLSNHNGLIRQLKRFNEEEKYIAAICAAPMILGSLDFLVGKKAVCYPGFESKLNGATVLYTPFAVDGHLITGRGVGTALDFSLEIVHLLKGEKVAKDLRTSLVIP